MSSDFLISICIPSYNRPLELNRLLNSIENIKKELVQIVICEDNAPKRNEIRLVVEKFKNNSRYSLKYCENIKNLGHGGNFRECIKQADGEFIVFMGDDDMFIPGKIDDYCNFIKNNLQCGYILRSSRQLLNDEVYVFWACGVTPQNAILDSIVPFCISHTPGYMLITDVKEDADIPILQ